MPWNKKPNVAMYAGADWSTLVKQVSNTTVAQARRLALLDPRITFFFFCNGPMVLDPTNGNPARHFQANDAVFFSGAPWYGEANQCDAYEKNELTVVYMNPHTPQMLRDVAAYQLPDGTPAIDIVTLFAGNYASDQVPYLRAENNHPPTQQPLNPHLQDALDSGAVQYLQEQGITVLLTVLNGWAAVGWSQFAPSQQAEAQAFAEYLQTEMVDKYGLDGIDIDDEYSTGQSYDTSLAMVTSLMRELMPGKLITKALWADTQNFGPQWQGRTLADNLTYGWEMSYFSGGPDPRLSQYLSLGLIKNQLALGFSAEESKKSLWYLVQPEAVAVLSEGYAGGMMYAFDNQPDSLAPMQTMVDTLCGPGSWNVVNTTTQP